MKNIRKTLCLLLVVVTCLSLALLGCENSDKTDHSEKATVTTTPVVSPNEATSAVTESDPTEDVNIDSSFEVTDEVVNKRPDAPSKGSLKGPGESSTTNTTKSSVATELATKPDSTETSYTQSTVVPTQAPAKVPATTIATVTTTKAPSLYTSAPTQTPTIAPTAAATKNPTTQGTRPSVSPNAWKDDNALKILTIGNSFSVDAMEYAYQIAKAAGVKNIKLGNLYIGACALSKHLSNAKKDSAAYTYYTNDSGVWNTTKSHKMSDAIVSENWDFVSFQQVSSASGQADTYDDLNDLFNLVEPLCTNENVQFVWHMTWAYQGNSTHDGFARYNNDQMTMYNAITSTTQSKIVPNKAINIIIPNGTVVQNARTSYVGDTLTRDGYHMSKDEGRKLTGLGLVAALIGVDWDTIDLSSVISDVAFRKVAVESVQNALKSPFAVTKSAIKNEMDILDLSGYEKVELTLHKNQYWQSTKSIELAGQGGTKEKYFATHKFTKDTLPVGSLILVSDGWKYRPEAWINDKLNASSDRPGEVSAAIVEVTENWWGDWTARGFNIAKKDGTTLSSYTDSQIREIFSIYIPKK